LAAIMLSFCAEINSLPRPLRKIEKDGDLKRVFTIRKRLNQTIIIGKQKSIK